MNNKEMIKNPEKIQICFFSSSRLLLLICTLITAHDTAKMARELTEAAAAHFNWPARCPDCLLISVFFYFLLLLLLLLLQQQLWISYWGRKTFFFSWLTFTELEENECAVLSRSGHATYLHTSTVWYNWRHRLKTSVVDISINSC